MPFGSLWLPVIVSAAVVWVLSAVLHMVFKFHKADFKRLPNESAVADVLRAGNPRPGMYVMPYCDGPAEMKDPKVLKKYEDGPVGIVTVMRNGPPAMGKYLSQWLGFCFVVSFVTAYVARNTLHPGQPGMHVMQITGAVAFAGYALGYVQDSIWHGIPWSNALRGIADAVVYSVVTGLVFRLLWPGA